MCPLDVLFPDEGSGALKLEMSMKFCKISHHSEKNPTGPLLFVFDEAIFQHQIRNFGLFQAKTSDYGL